MPNTPRFWGVIPPLPAKALGQVAKSAEDMGLEGLWGIQLYGPPFAPLAAAAMVTDSIKLGTGVAQAFVRSPLETACAALELDIINGGRTVLGIGPTLRWWNEDWHGVRYGKPIPHLREAVEVIRMIISKGHTGKLGKWEGEYYTLNLDGFKTLYPPVREDIPIYLPALFETASRVAGEIADGLAGHPIWCEQWIMNQVKTNVAKGLNKAGKERSGFDLNIWLYVAPGPDKKQCIEDARRTVASYSSFSQYERYFSECGFGDEARAIAQAAETKDDAGMLNACTDAMVENFSLVGPIDEVRARVGRIAQIADSFTLCAPFQGLAQEQVGEYNQRIAEVFYG